MMCNKMFTQACKINSYVLEDNSNNFDLHDGKNVRVKIKYVDLKKYKRFIFYHFYVHGFSTYFENACGWCKVYLCYSKV